jgi:hypothetical protein
MGYRMRKLEDWFLVAFLTIVLVKGVIGLAIVGALLVPLLGIAYAVRSLLQTVPVLQN